ncbi:hypothetical protein HJ144_24445 [Vibrio parahaemolyticus]|nr:hypothetical protein [Vibrio parahaemolyticus]
MKNQKDYEAGWTKSTINPKTGKKVSGGAARNMHVANKNGLEAMRGDAFLSGMAYVQPLLDSYQKHLDRSAQQLEQSQALNASLFKQLQEEKKKI